MVDACSHSSVFEFRPPRSASSTIGARLEVPPAATVEAELTEADAEAAEPSTTLRCASSGSSSSALCRKCSCEAREPERGDISLSASRAECVERLEHEPPSMKRVAKSASSGGTSGFDFAGGAVGLGSVGDIMGDTGRISSSAALELAIERALA